MASIADSEQPDPGAAPSRSRTLAVRAVLLAALMALGFLLRVYRLDEQSAWCDECNFFFLPVPDLGTYLGIIRFWAADNVPLYYVLLYSWSRVFGVSLVAARMLTILCGVACIPLAYAIGRRVFDARAGWIAAFCVAISPFQIWHAQSMRPYGVCIPLVFLGAYALVRAQEGRWFWWIGAFAINAVLLWLHAFMALLIPVQVLYLLGVRPRGLRRAAVWSLAQALVVLPPYLWLRPRLLSVPEAASDHLVLPGLWTILVDLFGDDVTHYSSEFPIAPPGWVHLFPGYDTWGWAAGIALMAFFGALALWAIPRAVVRWRKGDSAPALLLGTAFVPVLMLVGLSYVWRPCIETRHTAYASVALYIVAAGMISSFRRPMLRAGALVALVGMLSLQLALFLPGVSRTEWRRAARHIESRQRPEDIVLVKGIMHWAWTAFRANQEDHAIPVLPAHTIDMVCDKTAAFFTKQPHDEDTGRVWAVIELPFLDPQALEQAFAARLSPRGISASYVHYPGMEGILLCCFARGGTVGENTGLASEAPEISLTDYDAILRDIGMEGRKAEEKEQAVRALRRVIDLPVPLGKNNYVLLSLLLAETDDYGMGEACARRAVQLAPGFANGHFALGVALAGQGDVSAALAAFRKAFALDPIVDSLYGALIRALYETPNEEGAAREIARLAATGFPFSALRRLFAARFPAGEAADPGMVSRDPLWPYRTAEAP